MRRHLIVILLTAVFAVLAIAGCSGSVKSEGPGSYSHAQDAQFCDAHHCIPYFPNGSGYIVECTDTEWSHSGGRNGACSYHSGVLRKS